MHVQDSDRSGPRRREGGGTSQPVTLRWMQCTGHNRWSETVSDHFVGHQRASLRRRSNPPRVPGMHYSCLRIALVYGVGGIALFP
jgi:hypothetical protein